MGATKQEEWATRTGADQSGAQLDGHHTKETPEFIAFLMSRVTGPEQLTALFRDNPRYWDPLARAAQQRFGNAEVTKALAAVGSNDHTLMLAGRDSLKGSSSSATVDAGAPSPNDKLPYHGAAAWNAIEINRRLGQHDRISGTDNDGDRCSFAGALAIKIFDGPAATAAWLEAVVTKHDMLDGRPAKEQAETVLCGVATAIRDGVASYGDLSWAQEALYEVTLRAGQVGTAGIKPKDFVGRPTLDYALSDDLPATEIATSIYSEADFLAKAKQLAPGERYTCGWISSQFSHQVVVANHKGRLYLYDSETQADGQHLRELTMETIKPYFADGNSMDIYLKIPAAKPVVGGSSSTPKAKR